MVTTRAHQEEIARQMCQDQIDYTFLRRSWISDDIG